MLSLDFRSARRPYTLRPLTMTVTFRALVTPVVGLVSLLLCPGQLQAQPSELVPIGTAPRPTEEAKPSVVTPPKLTKFIEASYPPAALEQGLTARVELELVVGVDGRVRDLKVVTPVGNGFDEAAVAAVQQFEFEPATKDGAPIAARIRYPYVFEIQQAPPPEPEPEAPPPPARFEGRVLDADGDAPLAGATVQIVRGDGAVLAPAVTDAEGHFALPDLPAGTYTVRIDATGKLTREQPEELRSGELTEVVYRLQTPPDSEAFGAVARIEPPPREVTRRTIGKEVLTRIPGTRGDPLRTVELMPGVARPPLGAGLLIIRGSAPNDTQAMFEGLPVQLLYHFGGLTSFINARMIDSIDFYPGNFSVRYGRRRGGIIEVDAAEIPRDAFHGVADVNLIDASLLLETPIGDDAEIAVAARRSYFDVLFGAALSSGDVSTIAAPVYYDYQAMATYHPGPRDKLRLMAYGSSDKLKLLFEQPNDSDSAAVGNFDFGTQFHRVHGSWRRPLSSNVDQDVDVAVGYLDADFGLGEAFKFNLKGNDIYARAEWRVRVTDSVRLIAGLDLFFLPGDFTYKGPPVDQSEGNPDGNANGATLSNRDRISVQDEFFVAQPAAYVESDVTLGPVLFILGSRADYFSDIHAYTYDPRGAVHYSLTDTTKLRGGIGMFSQPPQFQESSPVLGNPHLLATHTLHVTLGVDQLVAETLKLSADGFYKHMYDRVVGTAFGQPPYFTNDGIGRAYGLEFQARIEPKGRFFGYLAYTLSRSERKDHPAENWELFDFDQTHILTVSAVYRLGRGWEAGMTFRLVSGNPETPVAGSSLNVITGESSPLFGRLNSGRSAMFNRLDVRIEKQWTFTAWKLALYLDVQNAYNASNAEGRIYDYEYRRSAVIRGLPIIPNLGLRGEL